MSINGFKYGNSVARYNYGALDNCPVLFDATTQTANSYLNSSGEAQTDADYCLSDYIPVIPNGTYKVMVGTQNRSRYFGGFYDSTKTYIGPCVSSSAQNDAGPYSIRVPSNAYFVRLCYLAASADQQKILPTGDDNAVTPKDFGAVGDGTTDDTVAFQRAVNSATVVYVPTGNGEIYKITSTISVPSTCKRIYGDPMRSGIRNTGMIRFDLSGSSSNVEALRETPLFLLSYNNEAFVIGSLLISSVYYGSGSRIGTFLNAVNYKTGTSIMPDKDIIVHNVGVTGFYRFITMCGRGLEVIDSTIADGVRGADLRYLSGDELDSNQEIAREYNQRGISFRSCRLHSLNQVFVKFNSGHGYGFEMIGCVCDTGSGQLIEAEEEAWNWNITGNVFQGLVSGPSINLKKGARNCVISGNVFSSDSSMATTPRANPINFIRMVGSRGCVISGNTFRQPSSDAIILGDSENVNVFNKNTVISGKVIQVSGGELNDDANRSVSDYISVSPGDVVTLSGHLDSSVFGTAFYDVNKSFKSGLPSKGANTVFTVPNDVYWIRVSVNNATLGTYAVYDKKQVNGVAITGNAFDALGENANPIRFKRNATNVSFAGNTDTAGKTLFVADSGVTVQEYVGQ